MKPTNTNILIEEIRGLTRIDDVWFFFKILKPDDEEFMLDKQRALEATEVINMLEQISILMLFFFFFLTSLST